MRGHKNSSGFRQGSKMDSGTDKISDVVKEEVTVKGREFHLIIDGCRYEYNGVHDWELISRWFFDSLADYEFKMKKSSIAKMVDGCPNCGGRYFYDKSDSGLLKDDECKCMKCGAKFNGK